LHLPTSSSSLLELDCASLELESTSLAPATMAFALSFLKPPLLGRRLSLSLLLDLLKCLPLEDYLSSHLGCALYSLNLYLFSYASGHSAMKCPRLPHL
jgi:hypothetical protein